MADGYIEQRMEEHRAGRGGSSLSTSRKLTPRGARPGEWLVTFKPCDIVIDDIEDVATLPVVRQLIGTGFKVFFRHPDIHRGQQLAKTLSAHYLPAGMESPDNSIIITHAPTGCISMQRHQSTVQFKLNGEFGRELTEFATDMLMSTAVYLSKIDETSAPTSRVIDINES